MPEIDPQTESNTFEVEITDLHLPRQAESTLPARLAGLFVRWQQVKYGGTRRGLSVALLVALALVLLVALLNPAAGVTTLLANTGLFRARLFPQMASLPASLLLCFPQKLPAPLNPPGRQTVPISPSWDILSPAIKVSMYPPRSIFMPPPRLAR